MLALTDLRYRRNQRLGIGMSGRREYLPGRCDLHQSAQIHHTDVIADVLHDGQIVRNEQQGDVPLALQANDEIQHLRLDGYIERRYGLISNQKLRIQRQRPGNADALALATGKLMGIAMRSLRTQAHESQ